jgi:hypothetical protein
MGVCNYSSNLNMGTGPPKWHPVLIPSAFDGDTIITTSNIAVLDAHMLAGVCSHRPEVSWEEHQGLARRLHQLGKLWVCKHQHPSMETIFIVINPWLMRPLLGTSFLSWWTLTNSVISLVLSSSGPCRYLDQCHRCWGSGVGPVWSYV